MKTQVYRNLTRTCWSLRSSGRVQGHAQEAYLSSAVFVVQPAGRRHTLEQRQKCVHAYVSGTLEPFSPPPPEARPVSYDPYRAGHFYRKDTLEPVHRALEVWLTPRGVYARLEAPST